MRPAPFEKGGAKDGIEAATDPFTEATDATPSFPPSFYYFGGKPKAGRRRVGSLRGLHRGAVLVGKPGTVVALEVALGYDGSSGSVELANLKRP